MNELIKLITLISVDTRELTLNQIQDVLINTKRYKNTTKNNTEEWNTISQILWSHLQTGLIKMDDQLLCATCFFSVLTLTDKQEFYMKEMNDIIEKEILLRSSDVKCASSCLQAVSLMYGIFQSSFLVQNSEKCNLNMVIKSTFSLLILMGYEYSQFTFIAFKTMNSFKKVCGSKLQTMIFSTENQIKLLNLVNHNWENSITGVRDLNKGIFKTLITVLDVMMLKDLVKEINSFFWNKAKYLMLSEITENSSQISNLIEECDMIEGLVKSLHKPGLVSAGADLYYAVLNKINCEDIWCKVFLNSTVDILNGSSWKAIENISNYWCSTTFKKFPALINILIDKLGNNYDTEQKLYSVLLLIRQGSKLTIMNINWDSIDNYTKTEKVVFSAIEHYNTQIRMIAFDIICLSQGKTLPSQIEYNLVLEYISRNINSDCTVLRINMLNSLKMFLSQLHLSFRNNKENNKIENLLDFCKRIQECIIASMHLNGNYQRKSTNVKVIKTITECLNHIPNKKKDQTKTGLTLKDFLQKNNCWLLHDDIVILRLMSLLKDPSDDIRENVGNLLLNNYFDELRKTEVINNLIEDALQSIKSKFFYEISCGQSIFKLIINLLLKEKHGVAIFNSLDDVFSYGHTELLAQYKLKSDVVTSIENGKQLHSFIGILQVVLETCLKNSYKLNVSDGNMTDLIDVLQDITGQFTWEQHNSTSSDFSKMNEMVEDIISKSGQTHHNNDETKISGLHQIVLNCLWLNVKASCDLASLLIEYHKDDIGKCQKCLTIITHVLEVSRHKGAIEAGGTSLGSGIQFLTSLSEETKVSKLPQTLLKTKLDILISEASKMASITRRGAGLSIMVHRIVSSDMRKGKPLFHYFMKTLLKTCQNTDDIPIQQQGKANIENQMDLPKAILIHFLSRIVTDSSLASDMMFYSAELAELAFSNLTSPHWQIRNAALQLYGALIPKLIGQKKASGTDDETIATVGYDELRTHSPKLWAFITEQLRIESITDKISCHSNLVPILNMLASIAKRYNFSDDLKEQMMLDEQLLKSLIRILDSPIHTVRRLTATCIFNIFSLKKIYSVLVDVDFVSENYLHGALLLLKCCHKHYNLQNENLNVLKELQDKFRAVLKYGKHSYWCKQVFESVYPNQYKIKHVKDMLAELVNNANSPGIFVWAHTCIKSCVRNSDWDDIPEIIYLFLEYNDFEMYGECLMSKIETENCKSPKVLLQIADILLSSKNKLYQSNVIWKILYQISLITNLKTADVTAVNMLIKDFDSNATSMKKIKYIIPFAAKIIESIDYENQKHLSNLIYKLSDFDNTDVDMRYIAAIANNELAKSFITLSDIVKVSSIKAAVILLQDEDEDVRTVCVDYYKNISNQEIAVHPTICLNKILDCNFLCQTLCEPQRVIDLCEDLLQLLSNNIHSNVDQYNPFANDSKNIYLEVDVLQTSLENLKQNIQ